MNFLAPHGLLNEIRWRMHRTPAIRGGMIGVGFMLLALAALAWFWRYYAPEGGHEVAISVIGIVAGGAFVSGMWASYPGLDGPTFETIDDFLSEGKSD